MTREPKEFFDIQRKNLQAGRSAWLSTVKKIKSELKSGVPKSEYKHVIESLKTREAIFEIRDQLIQSLIKIVRGSPCI